MGSNNSQIKLLDCTLRDGGHDIDCRFGKKVIRNIVEKLVQSNVEIVELGFLKKEVYSEDATIYNSVEQAKKIVKEYQEAKCEFALLAQQDQYDANLLPINDGIINCIRVSFHINDYMDGLEFCRVAKEKGYKIYCNPINIMGYPDEKLLELIDKVNALEPHTFTIVDTFGSMNHEDLRRIMYILLKNLSKSINLAVHLHENMSLSYSLAQDILSFNLNGRELTIDASLRGMGRIPGNMPIELISNYLNQNYGKNYDLDVIYDAIENNIDFFYRKLKWGYDPIYSLSGQFNIHRTYAEYLKDTGKLGAKDIRKILGDIPEDKRVLYDAEYIYQAYLQYMSIPYDDADSINKLKMKLNNKEVVLIASGRSILFQKETIDEFIRDKKDAVVISVNFYSELHNCDFAFFSNIKRYGNCVGKKPEITVMTSNLKRISVGGETVIAYDKLCQETDVIKERDNSLFMILNLLNILEVSEVFLIGFDGYSSAGEDYFATVYDNYVQPDSINEDISRILYSAFDMDNKIHFVTHSLYEKRKFI